MSDEQTTPLQSQLRTDLNKYLPEKLQFLTQLPVLGGALSDRVVTNPYRITDLFRDQTQLDNVAHGAKGKRKFHGYVKSDGKSGIARVESRCNHREQNMGGWVPYGL